MKSSRFIVLCLTIILLFSSFHLSVYMLFTRRLSGNFSNVSQAKMVDVGAFLPHDPNSSLPKLSSPLILSGDLPVLDGAAALVPVYASVIDTIYPEGSVTYEGGSFSDDNYYGENFAQDSAMQYKNTVRGFKAVVDGKSDVFFCAAPSKEQTEYARKQGVELTFVSIGLEAFVFFVNEKNPVENLTTEQIRGIYSGKYKNWKQVGGNDRIINPVTRLEGSGSQTAFESFMGDVPVGRKSPFAITGGSIGFSFRYYMDEMVGNKSIKMLSLNGVYPTKENVQSRSYPIVAQFYAAYRTDNDNENIPVLIDYLLSEQGQDLIEANGYVRIK